MYDGLRTILGLLLYFDVSRSFLTLIAFSDPELGSAVALPRLGVIDCLCVDPEDGFPEQLLGLSVTPEPLF